MTNAAFRVFLYSCLILIVVLLFELKFHRVKKGARSKYNFQKVIYKIVFGDGLAASEPYDFVPTTQQWKYCCIDWRCARRPVYCGKVDARNNILRLKVPHCRSILLFSLSPTQTFLAKSHTSKILYFVFLSAVKWYRN